MSFVCRLNVFPPSPHFLSMEEMSFILFGTYCPSLFGDHNPHVISLPTFSTSFSTYIFHSHIKTCSSPIVKYVPYILSPTLYYFFKTSLAVISCSLLPSPTLALFSLISYYMLLKLLPSSLVDSSVCFTWLFGNLALLTKYFFYLS